MGVRIIAGVVLLGLGACARPGPPTEAASVSPPNLAHRSLPRDPDGHGVARMTTTPARLPAPALGEERAVIEPLPSAEESPPTRPWWVRGPWCAIRATASSSSPVVGRARAGQALRERGPKHAGDQGCRAGFVPVQPDGFVCHDALLTPSADDPDVLAASAVLPASDGYRYAYSPGGVPHYRWLPTTHEMAWEERGLPPRPPPIASSNPADALPVALARRFQARGVGSVRAAQHEGNKVALARSFVAQGRRWWVTPMLTVVPADRIELAAAVPQASVGGDQPMLALPFAFSNGRHFGLTRSFRRVGSEFAPGAFMPSWSFFRLSDGRHRSLFGELLATLDGERFVQTRTVSRFAAAPRPAGVGPQDKWISVRLRAQALVAYEGDRAVFAAAVSTGAHGMVGEHRTLPGTFRIREKWRTQTMGGTTQGGVGWRSPEVPFVAYYDGGRALHGAWWHDWFGYARSHGCINLSPRDAAWLWHWTEPHVPPGWYASFASTGGTTVVVSP